MMNSSLQTHLNRWHALREQAAQGSPARTVARIVGTVEYREGDGTALEIRRGAVEIEIAGTDAVLSWSEGTYHGQASMPVEDLTSYIGAGCVELAD